MLRLKFQMVSVGFPEVFIETCKEGQRTSDGIQTSITMILAGPGGDSEAPLPAQTLRDRPAIIESVSGRHARARPAHPITQLGVWMAGSSPRLSGSNR